MNEVDLFLLGFKKVSTRDKTVDNMVGIRFAYQKGNILLYPKGNGYVNIDSEGTEQILSSLSEVKKFIEQKIQQLKAS